MRLILGFDGKWQAKTNQLNPMEHISMAICRTAVITICEKAFENVFAKCQTIASVLWYQYRCKSRFLTARVMNDSVGCHK